MIVDKFVEKKWKTLMWLPIIALAISLIYFGSVSLSGGEIIGKDIELSGGKRLTFEIATGTAVDIPYKHHITSGVTHNLIVEIGYEEDEQAVIDDIKSKVNVGEVSIVSVGPALGEFFFSQMVTAIIIAFVFMSIIVFMLFRSFVPSIAVIFAAATDIILALFVMNIIGIDLSIPTIAALMTLIGYSVDTDILLTTEVLKSNQEENKWENIKRAAKTGLTLTTTTLVAMFAVFFISGSIILEQISSVLIIGLMIDIPVTWLTNTGLLRRYAK